MIHNVIDFFSLYWISTFKIMHQPIIFLTPTLWSPLGCPESHLARFDGALATLVVRYDIIHENPFLETSISQ